MGAHGLVTDYWASNNIDAPEVETVHMTIRATQGKRVEECKLTTLLLPRR